MATRRQRLGGRIGSWCANLTWDSQDSERWSAILTPDFWLLFFCIGNSPQRRNVKTGTRGFAPFRFVGEEPGNSSWVEESAL